VVQSLGNDVYRGTAKGLNLAPMHNSDEGNVSMGEGTADWIIKETDVPGEYMYAVQFWFQFVMKPV
jgi:hypothetical protein